MTGWVCVHCGSPVHGDTYDPWCDVCQSDTVARQAGVPEPARPGQIRAIRALFISRGEVNRNRQLRRIARITGRPVTAYAQLTAAEADTVKTTLQGGPAHGIR